jgi:4-hydroxy-tetrahydrodipicolinate synthase
MDCQFITPTVTVLNSKGQPDKEENLKLYEHLRHGEVSGFVILGSTGEFQSLDMERAKDLIDIAASFKKGPMRVFAGTSRMDPKECESLSNYAYDKGLDGVMVISPYYFPLSQDQIFDFYSDIASNTPAKIFIYNFPARTGYSVSPITTLKLANEYVNIVGFKDTILDMWHTSDLIKTVKSQIPHFEVYSGYDNNFAHNILSGGNGCVGGLSNVFPRFFKHWMNALKSEDLASTACCQRIVNKMMDLYTIGDSFIPIIKTALKRMHVISSIVSTSPLRTAEPLQVERVDVLLKSLAPILSSLETSLQTGAVSS